MNGDFQDRKHEPLILRVKQGSELDEFMRYMLEQDRPVGKEELQEAGLYYRSGHLPSWLAKWFDNVTNVHKWGNKKENHLKYVYINPSAPISIGADTVQLGGDAQAQSAESLERVQWPQAPPIIDSMGDVFRKPPWFDTMRKMVKLGRHIALQGPPGVGKDTAVQELAAQEGVPLVTVGGDAGFRRRDLVGSAQIAMGHSFMDVAEYAAAVVNGWWAVLSEVNAADADALLYINTQLAAPNIVTIAGKAYPVHPNFRLFITYNAGLVGTKPLPQSFKDRFFSIQIPFFATVQLKSVLVAHGMPSDAPWSNFIVEYGQNLWNAHERGQLRYQITSRRLMDAVALMNSGLTDSPVDALGAAVIAAIDNPLEAKAATQILKNLNDALGYGTKDWNKFGEMEEDYA
jgi:hypothetical protein